MQTILNLFGSKSGHFRKYLKTEYLTLLYQISLKMYCDSLWKHFNSPFQLWLFIITTKLMNKLCPIWSPDGFICNMKISIRPTMWYIKHDIVDNWLICKYCRGQPLWHYWIRWFIIEYLIWLELNRYSNNILLLERMFWNVYNTNYEANKLMLKIPKVKTNPNL